MYRNINPPHSPCEHTSSLLQHTFLSVKGPVSFHPYPLSPIVLIFLVVSTVSIDKKNIFFLPLTPRSPEKLHHYSVIFDNKLIFGRKYKHRATIQPLWIILWSYYNCTLQYHSTVFNYVFTFSTTQSSTILLDFGCSSNVSLVLLVPPPS